MLQIHNSLTGRKETFQPIRPGEVRMYVCGMTVYDYWVCALFRDSPQRYQLARMAVEPSRRGQGYGEALMRAAIQTARASGATTLYLLSNTALRPAISLYGKHGFRTVADGPHPVYARCNIVMELRL